MTTIADVIAVARDMAIDALERGESVAWVERTSESEWHAYVAQLDRRRGTWFVKRLSRRPGYGAYDFETQCTPAEGYGGLVHRVSNAAGFLATAAWEPATPAAPAPTSGHAPPRR